MLRGLLYQMQQLQGKPVRVVLTHTAVFLYKTTKYYAPAHERCIAWNDPAIGITWPLGLHLKLSAKDQAAEPLAEAERF